jgi:hypothetical protein
MGNMRWSAFWTILGTVAGVIGAGAAVHPLLQIEQHAAHLTFPHYIDSPPYHVWVVALSDTIVLTGRWHIRYGPWWHPQTVRDGTGIRAYDSRISNGSLPLKDIRVAANERRLVSIDERDIEEWVGRSITPCTAGEFEIEIEYKWKGGSSWVRAMMPLCVAKT